MYTMKHNTIIDPSSKKEYSTYEIYDEESGALLFVVYGPMAAIAAEGAIRARNNGDIKPGDIFRRFEDLRKLQEVEDIGSLAD